MKKMNIDLEGILGGIFAGAGKFVIPSLMIVAGAAVYIAHYQGSVQPFKQEWIQRLSAEAGYTNPENVKKAYRQGFPEGIVLELEDGTKISYVGTLPPLKPLKEFFPNTPSKYERCGGGD